MFSGRHWPNRHIRKRWRKMETGKFNNGIPRISITRLICCPVHHAVREFCLWFIFQVSHFLILSLFYTTFFFFFRSILPVPWEEFNRITISYWTWKQAGWELTRLGFGKSNCSLHPLLILCGIRPQWELSIEGSSRPLRTRACLVLLLELPNSRLLWKLVCRLSKSLGNPSPITSV